MLSSARLIRMLAAARRPLGCALLGLAVGCSHRESLAPEVLAQRILPPPEPPAAAVLPPDPALAPLAKGGVRLGPPTAVPPGADGVAQKTGEVEGTVRQTPPGPNAPSQPVTLDRVPCEPLTLPD